MISDQHDFNGNYDIEDAELMHTPPPEGFHFDSE